MVESPCDEADAAGGIDGRLMKGLGERRTGADAFQTHSPVF
jgi:hypothetical protein